MSTPSLGPVCTSNTEGNQTTGDEQHDINTECHELYIHKVRRCEIRTIRRTYVHMYVCTYVRMCVCLRVQMSFKHVTLTADQSKNPDCENRATNIIYKDEEVDVLVTMATHVAWWCMGCPHHAKEQPYCVPLNELEHFGQCGSLRGRGGEETTRCMLDAFNY